MVLSMLPYDRATGITGIYILVVVVVVSLQSFLHLFL